MRIEAIPSFGVKLYAFVVKKNPIIRDIHKDIVEEVCAKVSSGRILDIGTGPGNVPLKIAERLSEVKIVGVDLSPGMVELARKNAVELGLSYCVEFETANAASLPFENDYFDCVISSLAFHHWSKRQECMSEIFRVLKSNGQAYIYDIWRDTPREIECELKHKYGWFLAFLFLTVVRSHSSITLREAEEFLSSAEVGYSEKSIHTRGSILKLQLVK